MNNLLEAKQDLLEQVRIINAKFELSKTVSDDYYEPGNMEYLDRYFAEYDEESNEVFLRTDVKGLRYDNRSRRLEYLNFGDELKIERDKANAYNPNNFVLLNKHDESMGTLPAELCNALAPLYDAGYLEFKSVKV